MLGQARLQQASSLYRMALESGSGFHQTYLADELVVAELVVAQLESLQEIAGARARLGGVPDCASDQMHQCPVHNTSLNPCLMGQPGPDTISSEASPSGGSQQHAAA